MSETISTEKVTELLSQMPGVISICRVDLRAGTASWPYLDAKMAEFYDVPYEELRAHPLVMHRQMVREDKERLDREFQQAMAEQSPVFLWSGRIVRRSGETRWIETQTAIVRSEGEVVTLHAQALDVTWRKRLEEDLARSEEARKVADEQLAASEEAKSLLIERLRYSIDELSNPILEIWDDVLVMPIIGMVDSRRASDMVQRLLAEVTRTQASFVIIDLTGVEIVDTQTADHLMKLMRKVEIVGARCVLTGIRAAVAETLVDIGVDFGRITTLRNLKHGLREALRFTRREREGSRHSDLDLDLDLPEKAEGQPHRR